MLRKISMWALFHPLKAQTTIAFLNLLLSALSIYLGLLLFCHDIVLPAELLGIGTTLALAAIALYPIRRARHRFWKFNYARQETLDFVLVFSGILLTVSLANRDAHAIIANSYPSEVNALPVRMASMSSGVDNPTVITEKVQSKRSMRKALRAQYREMLREMRSPTSDDNTGKIVAIVFLMLLLGMAVAMLSCSVGCAGSNAGAISVAVGGLALVLLLGVTLIRR
ncbi:MAG TPA: hypothetical protein PK971_07990, partial [Saprospiraceae bacterium]|nr:hypothetical protein [Saprospiraceae bacterium]HND88253.1 hypothetical protein [Saprospiraceae bacterium]